MSIEVRRQEINVSVSAPTNTIRLSSGSTVQGVPGPQGPQGPQGAQGIQGIQGEAGPGISTYTHTQNIASSSWTISHNLNRFPSVSVVDSAGSVVIGSITYTDANTVVVTFTAAFGGKAYLN